MFRKNILIVDSDPGSRALIASLLDAERVPANVVSAYSLEEARRETDVHYPDLIVLDYCFEDGTGVEFCKELCRKGSTCPVVFFTALSREIDKRSALANGCSDYLINRMTLIDSYQSSPDNLGSGPHELVSEGDGPAGPSYDLVRDPSMSRFFPP